MHPCTTSPIGVYDSGVGGVSVLRALRAALPDESYLYVADSRHAPTATGIRRSWRRGHRTSLHSLPAGGSRPWCWLATQMTRSGTVLVLATAYTIQSPSVARLCRLFGNETRVILQACPGLAEQVERGLFSAKSTYELLESYVRPGVAAGADTIVLGCTHYAFLARQIAQVAGPGVSIIEPSLAIARQLEFRLRGLRAESGASQRRTAFYTSGNVAELRAFLDMVGEEAAEVSTVGE